MAERESFDKNIKICRQCPAGLKYAEKIIKDGHPDILTFYEAIHLGHAEFLVRNCGGLPVGLCKNRPNAGSGTGM